MPIYIYEHPITRARTEVVQRMDENHRYIDNEGTEWVRVFTLPCASIDSQIDPMSAQDFVKKTRNKKGTLGNLFDASKEASEKRAAKIGRDPLKEEYVKNWSKKRRGRKYPTATNGVIEI